MQDPNLVSLNALRVFVVAAECGGFKPAAARLGVTPGAVSRQVLKLEALLGVSLFDRSNNAIQLTEIGADLARNASVGVATLHHAIETATCDTQDLTVLVPTSLATRWLIPRLEQFRSGWPGISVRIETHGGTGVSLAHRAQVAIGYLPLAQALPTPMSGADTLIEDFSRPYVSPGLFEGAQDTTDLSRYPALQCAQDNWDWKAWLSKTGQTDHQLHYAGHFDLDDAAVRAAIAGLGMVLSPEFMVRDDVAAGRLCQVPGGAGRVARTLCAARADAAYASGTCLCPMGEEAGCRRGLNHQRRVRRGRVSAHTPDVQAGAATRCARADGPLRRQQTAYPPWCAE